MFSLSSLCLYTLVSGRTKKQKLKQIAALKAFIARAVSLHKKLIHHVPHIYAVLHDNIEKAFVCAPPHNHSDSA